MFKKPILTIDGPAASGKGSVSKKIAQYYYLYYLETGIFYRLLALDFSSSDADLKNINAFLSALSIDFFNRANNKNENLYTAKVSNLASVLAKEKLVRNFVVNQQKSILRKYPANFSGIILDGRDCGTVIAPEADLKIYMTASLELRAKRRHTQMQYTSKSLRYEDVYNELKLRDKRDMERDLSPLMKADGAVEVDSTNLSLEETINIVKKIIFSKLPYLKIKI